jgi:hypothetical protein
MKNGRLHIRVESWLADEIKEYAKRHGTTVTDLTDRFYRKLIEEEQERQEQLMNDAEQI